jgi:heat shock protein HslJ
LELHGPIKRLKVWIINGDEISKVSSKIALLCITIYTLVILSSCNAVDNSSVSPPDDAPDEPINISMDIAGTSWELVTYGGSSLIERTRFTLSFDADQVTGNGGCNPFLAAYRITEDQISIEGIGIRDMACLEPEGLMEQELLLLEFIATAERFEQIQGCLYLYRGDGEVLRFDPVLT